MRYTDEQLEVIKADIGNILVSAAAGSGKTAVLTERIAQRIISGQADVQNLLVMTFTDAAAREMRQRIESKLRQALSVEQQSETRQYLSRQLSLLPGARISTIHSFCLSVIRDFAYILKDDSGQPLIDSSFSVDDGIEADILLSECLDEWMTRVYEQADQDDTGQKPQWADAFFHLLDGYGSSHNDIAVRSLLLEIYHYLRSLPDYLAFADSRFSELQKAADNFAASPHAAELYRELLLRLNRAVAALPELEQLLAGEISLAANQARNRDLISQFLAMIACLRDLDEKLNNKPDWDEIRKISLPLAEISLPRSGAGDSPEKKEFARIFCENVAEVIYFLTGACGTDKYKKHFIFETMPVFSLSSQKIAGDIRDMLPVISLLLDLVKGLDEHYSLRKKTAGLIDFADFEHLALRILRQEEARSFYCAKFREIYVDEYQDTSSIQEEIIRQISADNCLVVGDIKQSIYRFRHARPRLFLTRAELYRQGSRGRLFELNRNFRSVSGILSSVNTIFSQLMSTGAGEIEYDSRHALVEHRADQADRVPVRMLLFNRNRPQDQAQDDNTPSAEQDEDNDNGLAADTSFAYDQLARDQQEALLAVREIHNLRREGVSWQDMAVLCRTRSIAAAYAGQLAAHGIPVQESGDSDFFDIPALRIVESLVHVLDNARQDIPLAALMRSGLLQDSFTDDELVRIRLAGRDAGLKNSPFHEAVDFCAANGQGGLKEKCGKFQTWLDSWREREKDMRVGELLDAILRQTGWPDRLALQPDGSFSCQLIRQFIRRADQFEYNRRRGLHSFARFLETIRSRGDLKQLFGSESQIVDGVKVMTIHGSKGLEFPVVFLGGINYPLNPRDSKSAVLISESLGIGMNFADSDRQIRYPTHLRLAMQQEIRAATLAEEMRLLYVAMTRARDLLIITGTVNLRHDEGSPRLRNLIRQAGKTGSLQLPPYLVLSCRSYLEWLILAMSRLPHIDLSPLAGEELTESAQVAGIAACRSMTLEWVDFTRLQNEVAGFPAAVRASEKSDFPEPAIPAEISEETCRLLQQKITAPYRYARSTRIPAKITISDLKRREDILTESDQEAETDFTCSNLQSAPAAVADPRGINLTLHHTILGERGSGSDEIKGAALGTLLHAFLRYLDLPAARQSAGITELDRQLQEMAKLNMISQEEKNRLGPFLPDMLAFVNSDLAAEMLEASGSGLYFVEMPFTLALPVAELYPKAADLAGEDRVLIQGIIDCWYERQGRITLVDFKSDYLDGTEAEVISILESRYSLQLNLYARALETITGKPVIRRLIWHIRRRRIYWLEPRPFK